MVPVAAVTPWKRIAGVGLAGVVLLVAAVAIGREMRRGTIVSRTVTRFALSLSPPDRLPSLDQSHRVVDISPDGTQIVFVGNRQIYLRRIDELEVIPIRGTAPEASASDQRAGPVDPFFSPDGQWVGYWQGGQLKKVPVGGGVPTVVCTIPRPTAGASWAADNTILFGMGPEGIWRVSSAGGSPEPIVPVSVGQGGLNPQLITANRVLYTQRTLTGRTPDQIVVYAIDTGTRQIIVDNGSAGRYLPSGHVVYVTDGTMRAVPFEMMTSRTTGTALSLVEGVAQSTTYAAAHYAVSQTGSLVFVPEQITNRTLVWVDRQGRQEAIAAPPRRYAFPRLSPDGTQIAVVVLRPEKDRGLWIWHEARGNLTRLATGRAISPIWTPDGRDIVFAANDGVQRQAADGSGTPEHLFASPDITFPDTMTTDGRSLIVEQRSQEVNRTGTVGGRLM
jgi:serine/threonine-protein kinase